MLREAEEKLLREYLKEKKGMSDTNITYFMNEFEKLTESEKSEVIYEAVGREIYKTNPVDVLTFIQDPYFLGSVYDTVFKIWKDMIQEIYPAPFCKKYDEVILSCATRCFGKGTEILMYDGSSKKVEDITVGDEIMGDDGTVRNVLSLARGREMMYKVIPYVDEDNFVICNAHHEIPVYSFDGSYEIRETQKLYKERNNSRPHTLEVPKYNYLKKYTNLGPEYRPFRIEKVGVDNFYGFTLDGNNLFRLKNNYIQKNCGKTYIGTFVAAYELYLLTTMINPIKTYSVSNIVFALLSKDASTAVSQIGGELFKVLTQSPYFKDTTRDKLSFSKLDKDGVRVTDDIIFKAGSSISTVIGTNLFYGIVDEMNAKPANVAAENLIENRMRLYQEMRDRRESSFSKAPKRTGMLMFTSSPTDEGDVLSEIIADTQKNGIPGVLIRDNIPRWEAREEDMDDCFEFFLGSDTKDPCIVDETVELKPEELDRVIKIPAKSDYYSQFRSDPYLAIQNIAGRRTMPSMALFNTVASFEKVFCKEQDIFKTDTPEISMGSFRTLEDFLYEGRKNYFSHPDKPDCYRYIHLDIAEKKDRFGLASVYSDRVKFTSDDGHEIYKRMYYVDFCLGVQAKNKESVDILKVLEFIYSLKEKGYGIKIVSTDSHQGELARQIITKKCKVRTEYLSMEKDKGPYLNLKNTILSGCLEGYKNPTLMRELRGLRESQKKIEKGKGYTDDMSDSLAGALWMCSQDKFYKKNNEAITELISQSGKLFTNNMKPVKDFRYIARDINNRSPFRRTDLGFRYGR